MDKNIEVGRIPEDFMCPKTGDSYRILGAVTYNHKSRKPRTSLSIGHYTAVTKRNANWVVYDDMRKKSISVGTDYEVHPELLFYSKQ